MYVLNVFANVAVETVELQIRQLNFSLYIIRLLYFVYLYISLMFGFSLVFLWNINFPKEKIHIWIGLQNVKNRSVSSWSVSTKKLYLSRRKVVSSYRYNNNLCNPFNPDLRCALLFLSFLFTSACIFFNLTFWGNVISWFSRTFNLQSYSRDM